MFGLLAYICKDQMFILVNANKYIFISTILLFFVLHWKQMYLRPTTFYPRPTTFYPRLTSFYQRQLVKLLQTFSNNHCEVRPTFSLRFGLRFIRRFSLRFKQTIELDPDLNLSSFSSAVHFNIKTQFSRPVPYIGILTNSHMLYSI